MAMAAADAHGASVRHQFQRHQDLAALTLDPADTERRTLRQFERVAKRTGRQLLHDAPDQPPRFDDLVEAHVHPRRDIAIVPGSHARSEEHRSDIPPLMRTPYSVFCL